VRVTFHHDLVMDHAQQFASELPLTSYAITSGVLAQCHAFDEPDEARLRMPQSFTESAAHSDTSMPR